MGQLTTEIFNRMIIFSSQNLVMGMILIFGLALLLKLGSYLTVKFLQGFMAHVEINVMDLIKRKKKKENVGFFKLTSQILWQAFEEYYVYKSKFKRRKLDRVTSVIDRFFLIQEGSRRLIEDTLHHTKYCDDFESRPDFEEITEYLIKSNPVFKKVYGFIPITTASEFLSILPNIFIVLGIFGTFIGIMLALPELQNMDLSNLDQTKVIMDSFLLKIAFSMNTSVLGIILSIALNLANSFFSGDVIMHSTSEIFRNCLGMMWIESHTYHKEGQHEISDSSISKAS